MSFKNQLIAGFLGFTLLFLLTVFPISTHYFNRKENILNAVNYLDSYYLDLARTWQTQSDFINYETRNSKFFETHRSNYLDNLKIKEDSLDFKFRRLLHVCKENDFEVEGLLLSIQNKLLAQNDYFRQMVSAIERRGFKDFGIEGQMRNNVHLLEKYPELDQLKVLSLRRHEKDYMIRNDSSYVVKLNELVKITQDEVKNNNLLNRSTKDTLLILLTNYKSCFNNLVAADLEIGIRNKTGYMAQIDEKKDEIESLLVQTQQLVSNKKNTLFSNIKLIYLIGLSILVLISISTSWYISKLITKPLSLLTASIKELVLCNFEKPLNIKIRNSQKEINILISEFNNMVEKLNQKESDRQVAHNDFLESERKYKDLANLLPQSIFEADTNGYLSYVNENWKDQLLYSDADINQGIRLNDTIATNTKKCHSDDEDNEHDIKVIRKDGSTFNAMIFTSKIIRKGEPVGERGVIIDISERIRYIKELRKEKAKAEESDKLKSAFLANMSHEIRTPMNAIIGFSEMLKDPELSQTDRDEFISIINANSESLLRLIEEIVDIAKIESGNISIKMADTNLHKMASELQLSLKEIKKQSHKQNVKLINLNENDLVDEIIVTDQQRLRQALHNLLTNAIKFTNKGFVRYGFTVSPDTGEVIFSVQDTGIGIPQNKQKIIFERFRKANENQERLYSGTGLGLYITKTILKMLRGRIWLDSTVGVGSNFYFSIPYERSNTEPCNGTAIPMQDQINISGLKILVAEDIESNFKLIKTILKSYDMQFCWVQNGIEAVDFFLDNNTADLILMDVGMPIMNGYEATQQIKLIRPEIPIIMQTAHAMTGEKEKCLDFGADDYISKPLKQSELVYKINQLIRRKTELKDLNSGEIVL
jgi:PAS domain S-box-containing protein